MKFFNRINESNTCEDDSNIRKRNKDDKIIALAGNPNVGKSSVFNGLTGMSQHTGNWAGKTVKIAQGICKSKENEYVLIDLPGTYSLLSNSEEEEIARNFICFGDSDAIIVVCDATCLERNLNLVLQILEIYSNIIICVNLIDEAKRKNIRIDLDSLSKQLGVPVIATNAQNKKTLYELPKVADKLLKENKKEVFNVTYTAVIEDFVEMLQPKLEEIFEGKINSRWLALRMLESKDQSLFEEIKQTYGEDILNNNEIKSLLEVIEEELESKEITHEEIQKQIVSCLVFTAQGLCEDTVFETEKTKMNRDRKIDKLLTSRWFGYPLMILCLMVVFWITITGANVPSAMLANGLFWIEEKLVEFAIFLDVSKNIYGILIFGIYRVLAWVVSVMLPPMMIFFPLFSLLEDLGYLPRVAFNLDKSFKRCNACGKQALTM